MPHAQQKPLPGLGNAIGALNERLRSLEQDRATWQGVYTPAAPVYTSSSGTLTAPPGWPTFTFQTGAGGAALVFFQCYGQTTNPLTAFGFYVGYQLDAAGAIETSGSGETDVTPAPPLEGSGMGVGLCFVGGQIPYSQHTVQLFVALAQAGIATVSYSKPFFVAKSF